MAALGLGLGLANPTHPNPSPSPSPSPSPNPNPNQVRPEMAALQRARRSGTDRDALGRAAQTVLRFLTLTLTLTLTLILSRSLSLSLTLSLTLILSLSLSLTLSPKPTPNQVLRFFFRHGLGPAPVVLHDLLDPKPYCHPNPNPNADPNPNPNQVLHDLLVMPGHGNPLAILHASICAAACAALRLPGFVVVDAQACNHVQPYEPEAATL